ncbi:MAG TPA: transcription termination factor NusA [Dehalococcoidia bacterium]|nr:transcription termination factor NusA [Dehalococcoidia bacterium]
MKTEFVIALTQLAAERNLPKEVILRTMESALVPIFKKTSFAPDQEIWVKISSQTGEVKVFARKTVVKRRKDPRQEMLLSEARKHKPEAQVGDVLEVEATPEDAGRIAAQTAKQVILQRLREAERDAIFGEYADKEGDIVSGVVHAVEAKHVSIDLGKAEGLLVQAEQMATDHYRIGQRLKLYLMKVMRTAKGTQLILSRTHQGLLRRLFELEVPEIFNGTVEIKAVAREPGVRSKVAVAARQEGVDAVGSCLGLRSIRIQNITKELGGEKIDVIQWHPDPNVFIGNALSPAATTSVEISTEEKTASVVVPDKQLSLAIGKGGQNARLAARLTGWRIDIKSTSMVEGAAPAKAEAALEEPVAPPAPEAVEATVEAAGLELAVATPEAAVAAEGEAAAAVEEAKPIAVPEEAKAARAPKIMPEEAPEAPEEAAPKTLTFEEILSQLEAIPERRGRPRYTTEDKMGIVVDTKPKKGKKAGPADEEPGVKPKVKKGTKRRVTIEDEDLMGDDDIAGDDDIVEDEGLEEVD